jgi:hypothetical protein
MNFLSEAQKEALTVAVQHIFAAAQEAGPAGAKSDEVFAELAQYGMKLDTYNSLIAAMERAGRIRVEDDCIHLSGTP